MPTNGNTKVTAENAELTGRDGSPTCRRLHSGVDMRCL
jgi:hypothetical protein